MKRILSVEILLVLLLSVAAVPCASAALGDDWSLATIQVSMDDNYVCARYDISVYLDGELISVVSQGELLTFDVMLAYGQHRLEFVPDSQLAGPKTWTFSVSRDSCTVDCSLRAHILYLQFVSCSVSDGNSNISHEERSRILDRVSESVSFIRIIADF